MRISAFKMTIAKTCFSALVGAMGLLSFGNVNAQTDLGSSTTSHAEQAVQHTKLGVAYYMYVVAVVPRPGGQALYALKSKVDFPTPTWGALEFPMNAYLSNISADAETLVIVDVLTNSDLTQFPGATLYLGYGTSSEEMLAANRYKAFMTVPLE